MLSGVKIEGRPVWAEIHTRALESNLRAIRRHLDSGASAQARSHAQQGKETVKRKRVQILAVVKGDGYGHGAVGAAMAFAKAGADWFGVTCAAEGAELRESGVRKPILVLTGFWDGEEESLIEFNLTPAVTHCSQVLRLERAARARRLRGPLGFHLKIDTGMNRLGISPESVDCLARTLHDCPHLRLTGTFTHLASSEDFTSPQTSEQKRSFLAALDRVRGCKLSPGLVHMANSAAITLRPETWMDMVRPGANLYGYHQNYNPPEIREDAVRKVQLEPAISFRTRVTALKDIRDGGRVGYNGRFRPAQPMRIAILAAGYGDGVPRRLSNCGRVILRGKFAPVVGMVSMDLTAVDVTSVEDACVGDVATIYGPDSTPATLADRATQDASDVARMLGTRASDLLCMLSKRVPRIYLH